MPSSSFARKKAKEINSSTIMEDVLDQKLLLFVIIVSSVSALLLLGFFGSVDAVFPILFFKLATLLN